MVNTAAAGGAGAAGGRGGPGRVAVPGGAPGAGQVLRPPRVPRRRRRPLPPATRRAVIRMRVRAVPVCPPDAPPQAVLVAAIVATAAAAPPRDHLMWCRTEGWVGGFGPAPGPAPGVRDPDISECGWASESLCGAIRLRLMICAHTSGAQRHTHKGARAHTQARAHTHTGTAGLTVAVANRLSESPSPGRRSPNLSRRT